VANAVGRFLSSASMYGSSETIRRARELNPKILILARSVYLCEIPGLREAGADVVFSAEGEVALAMTEFLLRKLGATGEQLERERERIRSDLFPEGPDHRELPEGRAWPDGDEEVREPQRIGSND
jgi:monovalent cation:H+ antiporter-2, CPA2 family